MWCARVGAVEPVEFRGQRVEIQVGNNDKLLQERENRLPEICIGVIRFKEL
jgi:hypothetical protein